MRLEIEYNNGRRTENILEFATKYISQLLLTDKNIIDFKKSANVTVISAFNPKNDIERTYLPILPEFQYLSFGYIVI